MLVYINCSVQYSYCTNEINVHGFKRITDLKPSYTWIQVKFNSDIFQIILVYQYIRGSIGFTLLHKIKTISIQYLRKMHANSTLLLLDVSIIYFRCSIMYVSLLLKTNTQGGWNCLNCMSRMSTAGSCLQCVN